MTSQGEQFRIAIALAKQLNWPLREIPKPFQLSELDDYLNRARAELAARKAAKAEKQK